MVRDLIHNVINDDVKYSKAPVDMRYQRAFAVRAGVNGFLDAARQAYIEASDDVLVYQQRLIGQKSTRLSSYRLTFATDRIDLKLELRFDTPRHYYFRFPASEVVNRELPEELINVIRKRDKIECSTVLLMQKNIKISQSNTECLLMSDNMLEGLADQICQNLPALFKICDGIAMLDMMATFAQLTTSRDFVRPELISDSTALDEDQSGTLAVEAARHPIKEKIHAAKFVPNDIYATQQNRFQIITGCNMSGKSTYIRSVALLVIVAQIGCFVPARYAHMPIHEQLFARVSADDGIESNMSTFSAEMREISFILRNIGKNGLAIIDELGRGTSTRDGLAIAIAISETLIQSRALVYFATHLFTLASVLGPRMGVRTLHLVVSNPNPQTLVPLYRIGTGPSKTSHYGLMLARLVPLPSDVVRTANQVAKSLKRHEEESKRVSETALSQKRRRVVLSLREQLMQTQESRMEGEALRNWLKTLQDRFVEDMSAVNEESPDRPNQLVTQERSQARCDVTETAKHRSASPQRSRIGSDGDLSSNRRSATGQDIAHAHRLVLASGDDFFHVQ